MTNTQTRTVNPHQTPRTAQGDDIHVGDVVYLLGHGRVVTVVQIAHTSDTPVNVRCECGGCPHVCWVDSFYLHNVWDAP